MLPTGTVTFLMTDVEDSTGLVERLGDSWEAVRTRQRELVRDAVAAGGGAEIDVHGDEVFAAFAHASAAATAARDIQRVFAAEPWPSGAAVRVRIGLHTGEPRLSDEGYLGIDVHIAARVCAAGNGGQVLLSRATAELLGRYDTVDLGEHQLKGVARATEIFQLIEGHEGDPERQFPPLRVARDDAGLAQEREPELAGAALAALGRRARAAGATVRRRRRGLADLGWDARARRGGAPPTLRAALTELATALLDAARAAAEADRLVARTDRRTLTRRLAEYRDLAVLSRTAADAAAAVEQQLSALDRVGEARAALATLQPHIEEALAAATSRPDGLAPTTGRVRAAAGALAAHVMQAQELLGDTAVRLHHTRMRGVYRLGDLYVVPFVDSVGLDRLRRFDSRAEAKAFALSVRIAAKAQSVSRGSSYDVPYSGGGDAYSGGGDAGT